ncbi:trafficking protein Mon1-domain-containing protein [Crepidotus variabilis]|uniref:Vacuolar fusion protein MON1 n=1 Tax=Crepidotus variabilis TaxID=179855 RepID=A0A9P6ETC2_9AGAR|nr:trafficking protein Mon1-domain-containing protein [Crepidotus variabilis]
MTDTPRSRSVSRSGTPGLARASPSKLSIAPTLRPSPSLSNLHIHSHNMVPNQMDNRSSTSPPATDYALDSSASSVINVEPAEGLLIQDIDAEHTDTEDTESFDKSPPPGVVQDQSEGPKQALREKLRKSLSQRAAFSDSEASRPRVGGKHPEAQDLTFNAASLFLPREYFVLTDAGKPVYVSRPGSGDQDGMASTIGIMQALISVFLDENDKIRSINSGRTRITFLLRTPLYYVCASSWGEPESVTRLHLEYLHLQILSIVSGAQLKKLFERRTNFDLRRLLNGAETFMNSLLIRLETDISMTLSSLHCLKVESNLRKRLAEAMIPSSKMKDILYIILIANHRVVTLIRPRKHSIHPSDIHIIMNTIHSPSIFNSPAAASWIPVCLPKFNPSGFVNTYITFLRKDDIPVRLNSASPPSSLDSPQDDAATIRLDPEEGLNESGIALVSISAGGDFEMIRNWCDSVINKITSDGTLGALVNAYTTHQTDYSVSELGIPGLRHFIYKSRTQVQITLPTFEDPYDHSQARKRLVTLYQVLHDSIHAKSGQEGGLKLQYIKTDNESVMGWITQPFELYIALSPLLPKSAAVGAANSVARWVKKEEGRLFLKDAPVF